MTQTGAGAGVVASPPVQVRFTPASLDHRVDLTLRSGRRRVFDAMLHVSAWWPHRMQPGSAIVMEPHVGGRFFEDCGDGCGVLLGQLSRLVMPETFSIEGALGFEGPVAAVWSVRLDAEGHDRTVLHGRLEAVGSIDDDARLAAAGRWDATYAALAHYLDA